MTLEDLQTAVTFSSGGNFGFIYHELWIPRYAGNPVPANLYPTTWNYIINHPNNITANETYQWPSKMTDSTVTKAPILSDRVVGASTNLAFAAEGHTVNGKVDSVNVLFGDGHVDLHKSNVMKWRWRGNLYAFY